MSNHQDTTLRNSAGGRRAWAWFIPQVSGEQVHPIEISLLKRKFHSYSFILTREMNIKSKRYLAIKLMTDFGFSTKMSHIFVNRPRCQLERIFNQWESIIDGFWLYNPLVFKEYQKEFRYVLRKYLKVAVFNLNITTKYYKELVESLKYEMFDPLDQKSPEISKTNFFKPLLSILSKIDKNVKASYIGLAHVFSTRHLAPKIGPLTEDIEEFRRILSEPYEPPNGFIKEFDKACKYVLRICNELFRGFKSHEGAHFSISHSGSLDLSRHNGGKAMATLIALEREMNIIPSEDEKFIFPDGKGFLIRKGIRKSHSFNSSPCIWHSDEVKFGTKCEFVQPIVGGRVPTTPIIRSVVTPKEFDLPDDVALSSRIGKNWAIKRHGIDNHTGYRIYYTAFKLFRESLELKQLPYTRVAVISEPGCKARVITASDWWLPILEQPLVHLAAEFLSYHPSAHSVFRRQDQAWQALNLFQRIRSPKIEPGFAVLSSDLKNATDALPFELQEVMLRNLLDYFSPEFRFLLDLIGPRVITGPNLCFTNKRGALMGEPLTKIFLILSMLTLEEMTFSRYESLSLERKFTPTSKWRCCHIGGDDHLVYGPIPYLRSLTENVIKAGYIISPGKHIMSTRAVMYTEKVLYLKGIINIPLREIDKRIDDSIFCDSVKTRLLSPFSKVLDARDDRNIAVGKAKSLYSTLRYLPEPFKPLARRAIERFRFRFHRYVPTNRHKTLNAIVRLPPILGGLGLILDPQTEDFVHLPEIFWWALGCIVNTYPESYRVRQLLTGLYTNRYSKFQNPLTQYIIEATEESAYQIAIPLSDLRRSRPEFKGSWSEFIDSLGNEGYISLQDYSKYIERPFWLQGLLTLQEGKQFNTTPNWKRVKILWDKLDDIRRVSEFKNCLPDRTYETISKAARISSSGWFLRKPSARIAEKLGCPTLAFFGKIFHRN